MGFLLNLSAFSGPITISFTLRVCWCLHQPPFTNSFLWAPPAHLCLLSTSYYSHGLTTSFSRVPLSPFAFFGAFLLFCRPMYHCSYHSDLMVFLILLILLSSPFVILLGFFLPLALFFFCQNGPQQHQYLIPFVLQTTPLCLFRVWSSLSLQGSKNIIEGISTRNTLTKNATVNVTERKLVLVLASSWFFFFCPLVL